MLRGSRRGGRDGLAAAGHDRDRMVDRRPHPIMARMWGSWQFQLGAAGVGCALVAALARPALLVSWPLIEAIQPLSVIGLLGLVAASAGGVDSSATVLLLLPLVWFALTGGDPSDRGGVFIPPSLRRGTS